MTKPTKRRSTLDELTVRAIPSQYTEGAWASVRATIRWRFDGTSVSTLEERSATAVAHRLAADLLEATPPDASWCSPVVELQTSYRDFVQVAITVELAHGTEGEAKRATALLTEITKRLK